MFGMGLAFSVAGVLQSYLERVLGFGYLAAQVYMRPWMLGASLLGIVFLAGVIVTAYDLLTLKAVQPRRAEAI